MNSSLVPLTAGADARRCRRRAVSMRFLEAFAANMRNPHTHRAYVQAVEEFLAWCAAAGVPPIAAVQPVHVAP